MAMVRKQVYISSEQEQKLKRVADARGCTQAEVVREAIDRLPEYDDPITRCLAEAGLLAPPPDDGDIPSEEEAEQIEREIAEWGRQHCPFGLSEAVWKDREGLQGRNKFPRRPTDGRQPGSERFARA